MFPEAFSEVKCVGQTVDKLTVDITFHYPPDLMNLLIEAIPLLNKSKDEVLIFFQGAGVPKSMLVDFQRQLSVNRDSLKKRDITRDILTRLNEQGEAMLRQRREVLRRVLEFEDFSACWESDQLKARGLVAQIRSVVNVKDSFTRMSLEREKERQRHQEEFRARLKAQEKEREKRQQLKDEFFALFQETDAQKRGKALESVLNRLFDTYGVSVREAFTIASNEGKGIIEQIDGAILFDGHLYLVEMKWWKEPIGRNAIAQHLVRVFSRAEARGIFISATGYTDAAITDCTEALQHRVIILCTLQELVLLLERQGDFREMLKNKVNAAILEKKPFVLYS